MCKSLLGIVALSCVLSVAGPASAETWMPSIFGNGMVLQREKPVPVWGEADAGSTVEVSFAGQTKSTKAGDDGKWSVSLDALEASAEPREMTVKVGDANTVFADVLVGEVWFCSGQSNMQWAVAQSIDAELEAATANYPDLRLYYVPRVATGREPKKDIDAEWKPCTPDSTIGFSAVAYFFGRTMHKALGVPVGLVHTSWGGTRAEAWTPESNLRAVSELAPITETWDRQTSGYDAAAAKASYEAAVAKWEEGGKKGGRPQMAQNPIASQHHYSALWNGMVDALAPFAARGAIWYQGESNAGRAYQYRALMKTLIESWREQWNDDQFAFYQVQLANFMAIKDQPGESAWAELREAQTMVGDQLDLAGAAVITDIGAAKDIHPKDKQNVGKRLARMALVDLHGFNIARSGPVFKSAEFADGKATVKFETPGGGSMKNLTAYYNEPLTGFAIAGEDRVWHWADCKIVGGDTVVCTSTDVPQPVAVRYNWSDNPQGTLFNAAYLPAGPFRSDDWDGVTKNNVNP